MARRLKTGGRQKGSRNKKTVLLEEKGEIVSGYRPIDLVENVADWKAY